MSIVYISMKHNDMANIQMDDVEHDGYMPYSGIFGGDYTSFEVDNETGKIIGWVPLRIEDGKFVEC